MELPHQTSDTSAATCAAEKQRPGWCDSRRDEALQKQLKLTGSDRSVEVLLPLNVTVSANVLLLSELDVTAESRHHGDTLPRSHVTTETRYRGVTSPRKLLWRNETRLTVQLSLCPAVSHMHCSWTDVHVCEINPEKGVYKPRSKKMR